METKPILYNINETFYSIQGEGYWTGKAMVFLRLAGCNLKCAFCDTSSLTRFSGTAEHIVLFIKNSWPTADTVCITGGEPTIQPINTLVSVLRSDGYRIHMETNGTHLMEHNLKHIDWTTLSPKETQRDLPEEVYHAVNEIKWLQGVGPYIKIDLVRDILFSSPTIRHFIQPIQDDRYQENLAESLYMVKTFPELFRLSIQTQNYLGFK